MHENDKILYERETKKSHMTNFHNFLDDRRRGARIRPTEDNRRHTLGSHNDMLVYSQQNQNIQQRAMDLEVNINIKIHVLSLRISLFHFSRFVLRHKKYSLHFKLKHCIRSFQKSVLYRICLIFN